MTRIVQFIAVVLTALCLVPAGAHLLEMANKISLDQDQYVAVQQIYRGWAFLGIVLIAAIIANVLSTLLARSQPIPLACGAAAALLLCVGLAIFFIWTFPVNQATNNWTVAAPDWQVLRTQWEYPHAANAVVTFLALCSTVASGLTWSS